MKYALSALFLVVLIAAAIVLLPLSVGLQLSGVERLGLSAAAAEGSIWDGRLREARIGGLSLGDLDVKVGFLALVTGDLRVDAEAKGEGAFVGRATMVRSSSGVGFTGVSGAIPLGVFRTALPAQGMLAIDGATVRFVGGRCVRAEGKVSTDALKAADGPLGAAAPVLAGALSCSDGALLIPLAGSGPTGEASIVIRVDGAGAYQAESRVTSPDPQVNASLRLAGFTPSGAGQSLTTQGLLWR